MIPEYYLNYYCPYSSIDEYSRQTTVTPPSSQQQTPMNFQDNFEQAPGAPTTLGIEYTQGYLRTQIGRRMRITFLLGTNTIQDREGILEEVGISYIVIREADTNIRTLCDIYSVKFAAIFPQ
jgi:hypothetical protein